MRKTNILVLTTFALLFLLSFGARAQQTQPVSTTVAAAVTISVTNTFQQALPSIRRFSCLIQYTGANTGYVFFGNAANATIATSIQLKAQQAVSCANVDATVITDAVQVTGTATDTFVVYQQ
jgi:hypothetical protein